MLDDLWSLVDDLAPTSHLALASISGYYGLRAFLVLVATFGRGRYRKHAFRVLKVISRHKRPRGS